MADAQLDHAGDVSWFAGHGPAPISGACPHGDCEHLSVSVIAWGPDWDHYELVVCGMPGDDGCGGACRGWWREPPPNHRGSFRRLPSTWLQVDVNLLAEQAARKAQTDTRSD